MAELTKKMAELLAKQKAAREALIKKEALKLQKTKLKAVDELINLANTDAEFKTNFLNLIKTKNANSLLSILSEYE